MIESSKDIFYLVLAFCLLWFTAFVCWALWYVIRMLRAGAEAVRGVSDRLHAIDEAIRGIREKIEHSANYLGVVATGVKALIEYLARHKEEVARRAAESAEQVVKKAKRKAAEILTSDEE